MDTPRMPTASREPSGNNRILIILTIVFLALTLSALIIVVIFEQRQRSGASTRTPVADTSASPTPSATPIPTYQPLVAGLTKAIAVDIFLSATGVTDQSKLKRWEREEIMVTLRGQPDLADSQCLQKIVGELNAVMQTSRFVMTQEGQAPFEVYILPKSQFSTVFVDSPPDRDGLYVYYLRSDTIFDEVDMLINADLPPEERCWHMHYSILPSLGFLDPMAPTLPTSFLGKNHPAVGSGYSPYDLEMTRIVYSNLLTAGLTREEVNRRLLQE